MSRTQARRGRVEVEAGENRRRGREVATSWRVRVGVWRVVEERVAGARRAQLTMVNEIGDWGVHGGEREDGPEPSAATSGESASSLVPPLALTLLCARKRLTR